jgi:hypothetical protein
MKGSIGDGWSFGRRGPVIAVRWCQTCAAGRFEDDGAVAGRGMTCRACLGDQLSVSMVRKTVKE